MMHGTPGVREDLDPRDWREHRFGLSQDRWARLAGRWVWITGAGTGYGRTIAAALACAGAEVFITGRRLQRLEETCREVRSFGAPGRCHPIPADITREEDVARAGRLIEETCPALYGLVNNAAQPQRRVRPWPLQTESRAYWQELFDINVTAHWLVTSRILPHMARGGEVRVVFMSSGAGWAFTPGFGQYNISKAALNSLGGSLAEECADRYPDLDVQINVLNPGEARTEMNAGGTRSPFAAAAMTLLLLAHPAAGPNGRFFHADGRHLAFGMAAPYPCSLLSGAQIPGPAHPSPATLDSPPRLCGSLDGFNIVQHGAWYYGIPQGLGDLHLERDDVTRYPEVIREPSRAAVEAWIRHRR